MAQDPCVMKPVMDDLRSQVFQAIKIPLNLIRTYLVAQRNLSTVLSSDQKQVTQQDYPNME